MNITVVSKRDKKVATHLRNQGMCEWAELKIPDITDLSCEFRRVDSKVRDPYGSLTLCVYQL